MSNIIGLIGKKYYELNSISDGFKNLTVKLKDPASSNLCTVAAKGGNSTPNYQSMSIKNMITKYGLHTDTIEFLGIGKAINNNYVPMDSITVQAKIQGDKAEHTVQDDGNGGNYEADVAGYLLAFFSPADVILGG